MQAITRRRETKYLATTEFWVYLGQTVLPEQDEIMKLVLGGNSPIGPAEGLLLSDIRLHIGLVLRSKNPQVFRPDLFEEYLEPTAEFLSAMAESQAVAKIRYLSEEPLKSDAHLQLLPFLAYAYAKLGDGKAVYDVSAERFRSIDELAAELKANPDLRRSDFHVNVIWRRTANGGRAETRGLVKRGMPELSTLDVEADERLLVTGLVEEAARSLWNMDTFPAEVKVESFSDVFTLILAPPREGHSQVRIMRVQAS